MVNALSEMAYESRWLRTEYAEPRAWNWGLGAKLRDRAEAEGGRQGKVGADAGAEGGMHAPCFETMIAVRRFECYVRVLERKLDKTAEELKSAKEERDCLIAHKCGPVMAVRREAEEAKEGRGGAGCVTDTPGWRPC
jgi:hypothetical protein